ncbi:MAG: hypothetical protein HYZ08_00015, partial [Candidatus Kerfeldbacteria bacterium]|nr:hypothetical protein [Candidatus Kerfeldbacteria bacterium]
MAEGRNGREEWNQLGPDEQRRAELGEGINNLGEKLRQAGLVGERVSSGSTDDTRGGRRLRGKKRAQKAEKRPTTRVTKKTTSTPPAETQRPTVRKLDLLRDPASHKDELHALSSAAAELRRAFEDPEHTKDLESLRQQFAPVFVAAAREILGKRIPARIASLPESDPKRVKVETDAAWYEQQGVATMDDETLRAKVVGPALRDFEKGIMEMFQRAEGGKPGTAKFSDDTLTRELHDAIFDRVLSEYNAQGNVTVGDADSEDTTPGSGEIPSRVTSKPSDHREEPAGERISVIERPNSSDLAMHPDDPVNREVIRRVSDRLQELKLEDSARDDYRRLREMLKRIGDTMAGLHSPDTPSKIRPDWARRSKEVITHAFEEVEMLVRNFRRRSKNPSVKPLHPNDISQDPFDRRLRNRLFQELIQGVTPEVTESKRAQRRAQFAADVAAVAPLPALSRPSRPRDARSLIDQAFDEPKLSIEERRRRSAAERRREPRRSAGAPAGTETPAPGPTEGSGRRTIWGADLHPSRPVTA